MTVFYAILCAVLSITTALAAIMGYRAGVNDGRLIGQNKPLPMPETKKAEEKTPEQAQREKELQEKLRWIDEYNG